MFKETMGRMRYNPGGYYKYIDGKKEFTMAHKYVEPTPPKSPASNKYSPDKNRILTTAPAVSLAPRTFPKERYNDNPGPGKNICRFLREGIHEYL